MNRFQWEHFNFSKTYLIKSVTFNFKLVITNNFYRWAYNKHHSFPCCPNYCLSIEIVSLCTFTFYKEAFFLRHTTRLPSRTSQLVLFHHLFCIHFWGGPLPCSFPGVPLPCSLLGGPLLCSLLVGPLLGGGSTSLFTLGGGSTSMFTSGGSTSMFTSGGPLPCSLLGGSTSMFTSGGGGPMWPIP